jgi:hypothetical protein
MFRGNPHLASFQHSDIAGLPLDWHQRIREPSPVHLLSIDLINFVPHLLNTLHNT